MDTQIWAKARSVLKYVFLYFYVFGMKYHLNYGLKYHSNVSLKVAFDVFLKVS